MVEWLLVVDVVSGILIDTYIVIGFVVVVNAQWSNSLAQRDQVKPRPRWTKGWAELASTLRHVCLQTWLRALEGVQFYQLFAILVPMSWLWRRTWAILTQRGRRQSSSTGERL